MGRGVSATAGGGPGSLLLVKTLKGRGNGAQVRDQLIATHSLLDHSGHRQGEDATQQQEKQGESNLDEREAALTSPTH